MHLRVDGDGSHGSVGSVPHLPCKRNGVETMRRATIDHLSTGEAWQAGCMRAGRGGRHETRVDVHHRLTRNRCKYDGDSTARRGRDVQHLGRRLRTEQRRRCNRRLRRGRCWRAERVETGRFPAIVGGRR